MLQIIKTKYIEKYRFEACSTKSHDCYENSVLLAIITHHKQKNIFILKADLMSRTVPFCLLMNFSFEGAAVHK